MPLLAMALLGTGVFLTLRLRFINVRGFVHAIRIVKGDFDDPDDPGDISHFQALTTALSATVGVGNIAGVATAIHYGGPGALFWMWLTAALGMTTKFTECTLALHYREQNSDGTVSGGPMYYIEKGLGSKPLAIVFASCATISSFGSGNAVQAHTMAHSLHSAFKMPTWITGGVAAFIVALVILGGIKRIGSFTSRIVPVMAVTYVIGAVTILVIYAGEVPAAFASIITEAFTPSAAIGGFAGATMLFSLTWGIKRGLFSNEAGQGSAPIAHAAARTDIAVREGSVALLEPFIDTLTICTLTGLVIISTGVWKDKHETTLPFNKQSNISAVYARCGVDRDGKIAAGCALPKQSEHQLSGGKNDTLRFLVNHGIVDDGVVVGDGGEAVDAALKVDATGALQLVGLDGKALPAKLKGRMLENGGPLTAMAFQRGLASLLPFGRELVAICVLLFALSTAIGWSYYGERSAHYLLRDRAVLPYKLIFVLMHFVGAVIPLEAVWSFGDAALGMMSLPNLLAILLLSGQVATLTHEYYSQPHTPFNKQTKG
ncbi:MAG: sodium:alanine symporter family protein [Proteobacteria bacterium]|nr:MAG: sodium:alanine symporter family protein [Pseudomonadota bacterium]